MNLLINTNAKNIPLADCSVHCVVTSPPYYGLRDYGTAKWEGGDPNCDHLGKLVPSRAGFNKRYFGKPSSEGNKQDALHEPMGEICAKCGAVRIDQQIGLEQTPEEYVNNLVAVFREVRRVLVDDGIVYLNLGDSYAGSGCGTNDYRTEASRSINKSDVMFTKKPPQQKLGQYGYKPKDLLGIPWMVAFALRADGWYLRDDIIWVKGYSGNIRGGSTMPESVKDRCTKSYEHIFMLTKQPKYFYDYYATLEPSVSNVTLNKKSSEIRQAPKAAAVDYKGSPMFRNGHHNDNLPSNSSMSNPRNVWIINPKPYKGAHFATYPPKLIEPMILAGCPAGGIVLDPFVGSGTTVMVANHLGRKGIGLDLNFKYLKDNAKERIATVQPIMFS